MAQDCALEAVDVGAQAQYDLQDGFRRICIAALR